MRYSGSTFLKTHLSMYLSNDLLVLIQINVLHIELINKLLRNTYKILPHNIGLHIWDNGDYCIDGFTNSISPSRLCLSRKPSFGFGRNFARLSMCLQSIDSIFKYKYYMAEIQIYPCNGHSILNRYGIYLNKCGYFGVIFY